MPEGNTSLISSMNQSIFENQYHIDESALSLNLDDLINSDISKTIPILRDVSILYNHILGLKERFFMQKVIFFIHQFNSGIDSADVRLFVDNVLENKEFREKVVEKILTLLDRFDHEIKAIILAELLKSWVKNDIDYDKFQRLKYCVDRSHPSVFIYLYDFHKANFKPGSKKNLYMQRGFATINEISIISGSGFGTHTDYDFKIWSDALDLCDYGLKGVYDNQYQPIPSKVVDYVNKNIRKLKDESFFSDYERYILQFRICSHSHYELRKDLVRKIDEYISRDPKTQQNLKL